jgi:hypothetical protein
LVSKKLTKANDRVSNQIWFQQVFISREFDPSPSISAFLLGQNFTKFLPEKYDFDL